MSSTDYVSAHWDRSALVLIDVQHDFVAGAAAVAGTAELLESMTHLATVFRAAGRPIVHVVRLYPPGGSDVDPVRRALVESGAQIAAPGTVGAQIPPALLARVVDLDHRALLSGQLQHIGPGEVVLYKPRWSAFYRTRLDEHLRDLGVTTVVVAGCNLPNCPRATLFDASERDYRTVLVTDATSQSTNERLDDLALIGVSLTTTDEVKAALPSVS